MRQEFMDRITADSPRERIAGWMSLPTELNATQGLSVSDRRELCSVLLTEPDSRVIRVAMVKMLEAGCHMETITPALVQNRELRGGNSLDEQIWDFFREKSCLLSISERVYRRDEDALALLARCVPRRDFPKTTLKSLPLGDTRWSQLLLDEGYRTVLLLGRVGLLGEAAATQLSGSHLQYAFPMNSRPRGLARGDLHPDYHVVRETLRGGKSQDFRASEEGNVRTDYGLVQVYPVYNGRSWITIVHCAGGSSLGTLGAARWLANELVQPHDPGHVYPIPAPNIMGRQCRIEALLRVQGDATMFPWEVSELTLLRLRADHLEWSPDQLAWIDQREHEVTVVMGAEGPLKLSIDGQLSHLNPKSRNFRVAARIAIATHEHPGQSVPRLMLESDPWSTGSADTLVEVSKSLSYLKSHVFVGFLEVGDRIRLAAKVNVIDATQQSASDDDSDDGSTRKKPR